MYRRIKYLTLWGVLWQENLKETLEKTEKMEKEIKQEIQNLEKLTVSIKVRGNKYFLPILLSP